MALDDNARPLGRRRTLRAPRGAAQEAIPARESDRLWKLARSHDIWGAAGVDGEEDENGAGVNGRAYTAQGDCPMVGGAA